MSPPILFLLAVVGLILAVVGTVLVIGYVLVPLFRGVGNMISATVRGIAFIVRHVVEWIVGTLSDVVRLVGAILAAIVLLPIMLFSVLLGRWSAASHYAASVVEETKIAGLCLYRAVLRRPLHLLFLDGLVEGIEQRLPVAIENAPGTDLPRRGVPSFDGYTIVGSLRAGGSGAKLHVAEPDDALRRRRPDLPAQVVIKSFAISEGSALPQIIRESRSLESARQLGLVLDHGMDANRFFYAMPYHPGDNLGVVARRLHGESGGEGLDGRGLRQAMSLVADLAETLSVYHSGGLWHKDVKPDNIIVHGGKAHVVDLGLVTPLRSAMTLTTHGTEYFRDPEMVRMALRGVKVHQVDGAKFDIYAAGAVLYFVLENTFPAHGGLSSFAKRSPEALRWIVRRAMAEYTKRYERAETMLADLRFVLESADPYAVRPAQLPSMRGDEVNVVVEPAVGSAPGAGAAAFASAPPPPPFGRAPNAPPASPAWPDSVAQAGEAVSRGFRAGAEALGFGAAIGGVAAAASLADGPRLRVSNWWSGEYVPAVDQGPLPRGLSAREQREAIRRRAREAALAASAAVRRPRDPSRALVVLTVLAIGAIVAGALVIAPLFLATSSPLWADVPPAARGPVPAPPIPPAQPGTRATISTDQLHPLYPISGVDFVDTDRRRLSAVNPEITALPERVLLINTHPNPSDPAVIGLIDTYAETLATHGITVVINDPDAAATLTPAFHRWADNPTRERDAVERLLIGSPYGGVVLVSASEDTSGSTATPIRRRPAIEVVLVATALLEPAEKVEEPEEERDELAELEDAVSFVFRTIRSLAA